MQSDLSKFTYKPKRPPKLSSPIHIFQNHPMQARKPRNPAASVKLPNKNPVEKAMKVKPPQAGDLDKYYDHYIPQLEFGDQWHFLVEFFNFAQGAAVAWIPGVDGDTTNWKETRLQQANAAVRQLDNLSRTVC